ncbi:MAG TPA: PEP-CTERM sorting domain-containing protein [Longimicrobiaceae bacterium]|nr:PEP-CTERM sorting domain-containing protein [Longimicrobiaceae bacterium]
MDLRTFCSRNTILGAAVAMLALALPGTAHAFTWDPVLAPALHGQEQFKLTGTGNVVGASPLNGYYVGPYSAALTSNVGQSFSVYCVDFLNDISMNTVWTANVDPITTAGIAQTRLGEAGVPDAVLRYQKAVWLAGQFANPGYQNTADWTGIHEAIWATVNPGDLSMLKTTAGSTWYEAVNDAFASGAPGGFSSSGWVVLTDVDASGRNGGHQEFIAQMAPVVTPEPATYLLFGTGLLVLLFVSARRRRERFA